jgi:hypothetical protein
VKRRLATILAGAYLALVALATVPVFTGTGPLSGVLAVILASPWSQLLGRLLPDAAPGSTTTGLGLVAAGALVNAALIHLLSRWLVGRRSR